MPKQMPKEEGQVLAVALCIRGWILGEVDGPQLRTFKEFSHPRLLLTKGSINRGVDRWPAVNGGLEDVNLHGHVGIETQPVDPVHRLEVERTIPGAVEIEGVVAGLMK